MRRISLALSALALFASTVSVQAFDTRASAAYVVDHSSGTVLMAKDADAPLPPASMSKLMTLYMAFEAIEAGILNLDQELPVSAAAQQYGGSTMFLQAGERVSVEDLLRGISDGAAALAQGDAPGFMNAVALRTVPPRDKIQKPVTSPPKEPETIPEDTRTPFQKLKDKFS